MMRRLDYCKRAEECTALAQTARAPAQRTMLLHIADTWLRLARDAEDSDRTDSTDRSVAAGNQVDVESLRSPSAQNGCVSMRPSDCGV